MHVDINYFTKKRMASYKKEESRLLGLMALRFYLLAFIGTLFAATA